MFNPHKQLDARGKIEPGKCLYCHVSKPDEERSAKKEAKLIGELTLICQKCHAITGNHSGNNNHLVKPSAKLLARMQQMENRFSIILPLDDEGKLTCATCHNPHQKGVIQEDKPSAKGAGSKFRHRLPNKLCMECHLK